jgi:hypothetical protein
MVSETLFSQEEMPEDSQEEIEEMSDERDKNNSVGDVAERRPGSN